MEIDGYFAETVYPPHFPQEFAPAWIDHALRHGGHTPRRGFRGPFRYLDLGCGNGLQLILMAAGCPEGSFTGTDANAASMARAEALAEGLGVTNVTFRAETFAESLERLEPGFDYLTGLGLLTWVSAENRNLLNRIAGRVLAPGGAACFGYNALPGRAPEIVLQRYLVDAVRRHGGPQPEALLAAMDRLEALAEAGMPGLQHPRLRNVLEMRKKVDPTFLPHEYLSEHWTPLHSEDVIRAMTDQGLDFAGSLTLLENRPDFVLRRAARDAVAAEDGVASRQRLIDLLTDQGFRRDVYVRTPAEPSDTVQDRDAAWISATGSAARAELSLQTPAGRIRFDNSAARGMLDALEAGPLPVAEAGAHVSRADRLNTLDALMAAELVIPVEPPTSVDADPVNWWLAERAAKDAPAPRTQVTRHGARKVPISLLRAIGLGGGDPEPPVIARLGL